MKLWSLLLMSAALAPDGNRYPQSYRLMQEAEKAAAQLPAASAERQHLKFRTGGLYARAGYLADATRVLGKVTADSPVWRAQVVYGDLAGAEHSLQAITDAEQLTAARGALAQLLWEMGRPEEARAHYAAAQQVAATIANPKHRASALRSIQLAISFLSDEPPVKLSATPNPSRTNPALPVSQPVFPITSQGFRLPDASRSAAQAASDAEFLQRLFAFWGASDGSGVICVMQSAASPFQKTLGFANIEHVFIQQGQPELAEGYAARMPEDDSDCRLAKAEALAAAGSAWIRADKTEPATADFEAAVNLVRSVPDLPAGKVKVMLAIASAQSAAGLVAGSGLSFALAGQLAQRLPWGPAAKPAGLVRLVRPGPYREEMYRLIFMAAMRARDLGAARDVAKLWDQPGFSEGVAQAWIEVDRPDDAILCARDIPNTLERASVLLTLALRLLDQAGAPTF